MKTENAQDPAELSAIDIYVKWESYGYVATCPSHQHTAGHFPGPRQAAEGMQTLLGLPNNVLKKVRTGHYQSFPKS